jgi:hypothetical protein
MLPTAWIGPEGHATHGPDQGPWPFGTMPEMVSGCYGPTRIAYVTIVR